ncbi:MAG TPA: DUF2997 domain-containing protein [Bacilli bacterium]|nr:DUF2997 domain-containing protein [Bacilli bacterium]
MKKPYITINIDSDGKIDAETFEMEGIECLDELNRLMKDIASINDEMKKPEYYKSKIEHKTKVVIRK